MKKIYPFDNNLFAVLLLLVIMVFGAVPAHAQCGLSLNNSAGGTSPGGTLAVTSSGSKIQRIKWYKDGSLVQTDEAAFNSVASGTVLSAADGISGPQVFGFKDTLFIVDLGKNRIWKWWPGAAQAQIIIGNAAGTAGVLPASLNQPCAIAFSPYGTDTMWIAEYSNKRVYEFYRNSGTSISRVEGYSFPASIAFYNDTIYSPAYGFSMLSRFRRGSTTNLSYITGAPNARDVKVQNGYVYFAYQGNVMKYPVGSTVGVRVAGNGTAGAALNQIDDPHGIYVDKLENIYVVEYTNKRITKWEPGAATGKLVTGVTGVSSQNSGHLDNPLRVYIGDSGFMYVSDNNRVLQFGHTLSNTLPNATPGVYKAVTDGFNGCRDSISITIAAPGPAQPGNYIASTAAVCKGETGVVYRINKVATATSYNWSYVPAAGVTINTISDTSVSVNFSSTATSGSLSVVAVNGNGQSLPRDISVTVHDLPVINAISGNSPVCVGATRTLTTTPTGGSWSSGSTSVANVNSSGMVTGMSNGNATITYTYTDANSCTNTATASVTVNALPAVSVNPTGARSICQGDSLLLSATATGVSYQWKEGTTNVGAGTSSYYARANGSYTVTVTNTTTNCSFTSAPATVLTVHALPVATITPSGSVVLCEPDSITLTAGSGAGYNYEWKNATATVGASGSYTAKMTGSYKLIVTDGATSCSDSSQVTEVIVHSAPVALLTPGDTAFCEGGTVMLQVAAQDTGLGYVWMNSNTVIQSATASFLEVDESGVYTVAVNRNLLPTCGDTTNEVMITVHPLPAPAATWDGELFHADPGYAAYQWNTGSQPVIGENDSTFRPSTNGGYSVTVTDSNGCSNISPIVNVKNVSIDPFTALGSLIKVYPNPANADVHIQAPINVHVALTNVDGRMVWSGSGVTKVSLDGLADGVYFLRITDESGISLKYEQLIKHSRH